MPKYPEITVSLTGVNGNAFSVIAACSREARKSGLPGSKIEAFKKEAMSGDYDHLLQTCFKYFDIS